jgi:hypothetical protein
MMMRKGKLIEVEPMDSEEQDKVYNDLRLQIHLQAESWRFAFCLGFSGISLLFLGCFLYGTFFPWKFQHQYVFAEHLHFSVFQAYYFLSFIVFGYIAKVIQVNYFTIKH